MQNELIPPPDLDPPSVKHLPLEMCLEFWAQLVDENEALVRAGLRAKIYPDGHFRASYRLWYVRHMEDHDRMQIALAENLTRREARRGQ